MKSSTIPRLIVEEELSSLFWESLATHLTLLYAMFVRVWPQKDPPVLKI